RRATRCRRIRRRTSPDHCRFKSCPPATTRLTMPDLGINVPNMGNKPPAPRISEAAARYANASLTDALFTATQRRVLGCLFGQPGRSYGVGELIQSTGAGSGAVQRELARLAGSGLLRIEQIGKQKRYSA